MFSNYSSSDILIMLEIAVFLKMSLIRKGAGNTEGGGGGGGSTKYELFLLSLFLKTARENDGGG